MTGKDMYLMGQRDRKKLHVIRSESDNESVFELPAEKGKVYFLRQKVEMGYAEIRECHPIKTTLSGPD